MGKEDYTFPRFAEEGKQPSNILRTINEHRLGLWIPVGVAAIAGAAAVFISASLYDSTRESQQKPAITAPEQKQLYKEQCNAFLDDQIAGEWVTCEPTLTDSGGIVRFKVNAIARPIQRELDNNSRLLLRIPGYYDEAYLEQKGGWYSTGDKFKVPLGGRTIEARLMLKKENGNEIQLHEFKFKPNEEIKRQQY